jgi:hypothetical protein
MIFFPAKNNLLRRGVVPDTLCPICTREEEIAQHALWSCPSIQDVWGYGPKKLQKGTEGIQNFTKVFDEYLMERCDLFKIELIVVVAQKIWFHINGVVYGKHSFTLNKCSEKPVCSFMNFGGRPQRI